MNPGDYKDRIRIEQKSVTRDASIGSEIVSWALVATVWAKYEPLRGQEFFSARQNQAATMARFRMHYRADLSKEMRIVFRGLYYEIDSVIDVGGRRTELEVMTTEGLTNG
jgi:SPP1 family predicted phage head-tail adaptor